MNISDRMSGMASGAMARPMGHEAPPMQQGEGGGVHEHLAAMHAKMGGTHVHIHHDGLTHTTHHVGEDGKVQGPHEHPDKEAMMEHVGKVLGGGEEPENWGGRGESVDEEMA